MRDAAAPSPQVGIFWYDVKTHKLFGVRKISADALAFRAGKRVYPELHRDVWSEVITKHRKFMGADYTMIPRGRISEIEREGFELWIGSWYKRYRTLIPKVVQAFHLEGYTLSVREQSHWELGHGWSE